MDDTARWDWDGIRERTLALRARRGRAPLAAPLSEEQVAEAERQFGITFPADYRAFLTTVSAGTDWPRQLCRGETGWYWAGDRQTRPALLAEPFPDHDTALAASDDFWDNPLREEDFEDPAAFRAALAAWNDEAEAIEDARTAGAVCLTENGCGFATWLVVTGPDRGTMWFDGRATCDRLNPLLTDEGRPATFGEWYLDYLEHEEPYATDEERSAAHSRWHRGEDTPIWFRWFDDWREQVSR
ncbi:SMI1/KNR4 family protein [Kitasatospora sp. NPDC057904]|uniref:SMI1/KNR4 family protein n=1 Tax=Kitasatospora sp. NPDC057904 TaxID=3346275 RepID=UPI0036DA40C1